MLLLGLLLAFSAVSPRGAVAAAHPLASEAGASMLRRGGNAIDAAVAAAFALAVVEPQSSGIVGGGFALVYTARDRQVHVIDFREVAPAAARPDMYLRDGQARQDLANAGALSIAVPGAVRGYVELLKRWGKRPLREALAPAIALATNGFQVGPAFAAESEERRDCLAADEEAARRFLRGGESGAAETGKRLFALRQGWGDPDFNPQMAQIARDMPTKQFAASLRAQIGERATPAAPLVQRESGHTTHLSVVDEDGNAVALTTTVNDGFG